MVEKETIKNEIKIVHVIAARSITTGYENKIWQGRDLGPAAATCGRSMTATRGRAYLTGGLLKDQIVIRLKEFDNRTCVRTVRDT
jgi:hypothetical protein